MSWVTGGLEEKKEPNRVFKQRLKQKTRPQIILKHSKHERKWQEEEEQKENTSIDTW